MSFTPLARRLRPAALLAAALLPGAFGAAVQAAGAAPPAVSGSPTDPAAPVPAVRYQSAFSGYRPLGDTSLQSWRAANDEVGRIGGWRAYTREAQQALSAPAPAAAASAARAAPANPPAAAGPQR